MRFLGKLIVAILAIAGLFWIWNHVPIVRETVTTWVDKYVE